MTPETREKLDKLRVSPQYILPQHLLSRLMYHFASAHFGGFSTWLIKQFIQHYRVDMSLAQESDPAAYASFNDFFTRALRPGARPLAAEGLLSPVDGVISQVGTVQDGQLVQAKGHHYSVIDLLGGYEPLAGLFKDALFCTIYLSPRDYHRIHMPLDGQPRDMVYVPGRLFSVSPLTTRVVPGLFARNERLAAVFKTPCGPLAVVMVGAIFVGSIETVWEGELVPNDLRRPQRWQPADTVGPLQRGEEMGRFNMGSTVVLLADAAQLQWLSELGPGSAVQMGQTLARLR